MKLGRDYLIQLQSRKFTRSFYRLSSAKSIEHEFRGQFGHPTSYAFVRFDCAPDDELSFEARALWPTNVPEEYRRELELAIAEAIADALLVGVYPHTGCALTLVEVRYNEIGSSVAAFMEATKSAMVQLITDCWEIAKRSRKVAG